MSFYNERLAHIDAPKTTALISAEAAWQKLQDGKVTNFSIQFANIPAPQTQVQYWWPELKPGRPFDFIGRPYVLTPIEWQGKPLLMIGNATTANYPASILDELNKTQDPMKYQPLHVTGRLTRWAGGDVAAIGAAASTSACAGPRRSPTAPDAAFPILVLDGSAAA